MPATSLQYAHIEFNSSMYANSMSEKYRLLKLMNSLNTISWCSLRSSAAKKSSRYKQKQKFSHYWKNKNESWIHACNIRKLLSSSFIDKTPNDDLFCHEESNSDSLNFCEDETPSIFLFPGQNSEFVGMGRQVAEIVEVKEMFDVAEQVLGYNLLQLCLEGPVSKLRQTAFAQPAIFITSLAAVKKLEQEKHNAVKSCVAAAGYSIGEYAALVFSGALDFESGSHIFFTFDQNKIHVNATGLQRRLLWFDDCLFETKLQIGFSTPSSFKQGFENPICQVASSLYGQCKGLKFLEESSAEFNFKVRHLPVSGAFHTPLMEPVNGALRKAISMVQFRDPTIKVYSNVTGQPYKSADEIAQNLADQISKEAKWEQIMHAIYDRPKSVTKFPKTYEVGPGNQLGKILRRINKKAAAEYANVDGIVFWRFSSAACRKRSKVPGLSIEVGKLRFKFGFSSRIFGRLYFSTNSSDTTQQDVLPPGSSSRLAISRIFFSVCLFDGISSIFIEEHFSIKASTIFCKPAFDPCTILIKSGKTETKIK
ncbi:putative malonyl CoA-acyl carrier protein transacylase [Trichinella spiralis]|uniref:putative malonyl CoA-acyl carrier protein transacylase n=1 Tax=Trichinella spiralis TaxID=6334 RepID=UPI0001EFB322|nr:putative malonyl CoA-acyl carrier protein transacylase [Trichinella spiralis]